MKKRLFIWAAALLLVMTVCLAACQSSYSKGENGGEPLALALQYNGEGEDDPFHEFTEEEFTVWIAYSDGSTRELDSGCSMTTRTEAGIFIIQATWEGIEGEYMLPVGKEAYQERKARKDAALAEQESLNQAIESAQAEVDAGNVPPLEDAVTPDGETVVVE